jgi:charged multivesicular body protein 1
MGNKQSLEEDLINLRIVSKQVSVAYRFFFFAPHPHAIHDIIYTQYTLTVAFVSKMVRSSKKCEKNEKAALEKLKKAIAAGNSEGARIYGQDAIREKNQAVNHLRMASRLDACCSRIETAVRMNQVSASMTGVVKGMDKSLASMNIEQLSKVMDKFEAQFEDLDVKAQYMEGAMNATTATSTPAEQVDTLIERIADLFTGRTSG